MVITTARIYLTNTKTAVKLQPFNHNLYFSFALGQKKCASDKFRCTNGRCIDKLLMCDEADDCGDLSDEINCEQTKSADLCNLEQFPCNSNRSICVPKAARCNGTAECPSQEDEEVQAVLAKPQF